MERRSFLFSGCVLCVVFARCSAADTRRDVRAQLERQQEELVAFTELHEARGTVSKLEYDQKLKAAGFSSLPDLEDYLKKLEKSLTRARNRELGIDESENKVRLRSSSGSRQMLRGRN